MSPVSDEIPEKDVRSDIRDEPIAPKFARASAALFGRIDRKPIGALAPKSSVPPVAATPEPDGNKPAADRYRTGLILPSLLPVEDPIQARIQAEAARRAAARAAAPRLELTGEPPEKRKTRTLTVFKKKRAASGQSPTPQHQEARATAGASQPLLPGIDKMPQPVSRITDPRPTALAQKRRLQVTTEPKNPSLTYPAATPPAVQTMADLISTSRRIPILPERAFRYNAALDRQARRDAIRVPREQAAQILKPGERWKRRLPARSW